MLACLMFLLNKCRVRGCKNMAFSTFDNEEITNGANYCLEHLSNPGKEQAAVFSYIKNHDKIVDLNVTGMSFLHIDLTGKKFYGCNFSTCSFVGVHAKNMECRISVFDGAVFADSTLLSCFSEFSSFSLCTLSHTLFTGSTMVYSSFNGIKAFQSSFDDSDLYNSRFINSSLIDTSFRNCNLKRTMFLNINMRNMSFELSNTNEAIFEENYDEELKSGGVI